MKTAVLALVLANLVAGAWLLLGTPVDVVREPGRIDQQVNAAGLRVLTEAEFARKRDQARIESAAASAPAANAAAAAAAPPAATPAAAPVAPPAASVELPLASCIDIGPFASDPATRKFRTRLAAAGLGDHLASGTVDKVTRLRITGADAAAETQVHLILRDFPKLEMSHCSEAPPAR
jgi:phage-related tail fiber protein